MQKREIVEERIIEAATNLFSEHGFSRTSTREIARTAAVNDGILFRYFPRKEELFWTTLETRLARVGVRQELRAALAQGAAPAVAIPLIVESIFQLTASDPCLMRLLLVGLVELRDGSERLLSQRLMPLLSAICDYLAHGVKNGVLRALDPTIVTTALTSTAVLHQSFQRLIFGAGQAGDSANQTIDVYAKFWVQALSPSASEVPTALAAN
jgi:AcrR family transcriptional regulator